MSHLGSGRPLIVPVFLPFQGCSHRCVYCDQEKITSQKADPLHPQAVTRVLDQALRSSRFDPAEKHEVAFYGGTFTRLTKAGMEGLLGAVAPYLKAGSFDSIRLSTRPDGVDRETLLFLKGRGVKTVELGAQSMDDEVLRQSQRGHCAADTVRSVRLLREQGLKVGIQLMPGLPGDSKEGFLAALDRVIALGPDMVRLYPTVVIRGTELDRLYRRGTYEPWGLEQALEVCTESVFRLEGQAIPVIRIGLMTSPSLREPGQIVAGPWHEAFGHMVRSSLYHRKIESLLPRWGERGSISLRVHPKEVPLMRGFKNKGIREVEARTGAAVQRVIPDESLLPGRIEVDGP